jgi:hypothetical protein
MLGNSTVAADLASQEGLSSTSKYTPLSHGHPAPKLFSIPTELSRTDIIWNTNPGLPLHEPSRYLHFKSLSRPFRMKNLTGSQYHEKLTWKPVDPTGAKRLQTRYNAFWITASVQGRIIMTLRRIEPLLRNGSINTFLRRQILGKEPVAG